VLPLVLRRNPAEFTVQRSAAERLRVQQAVVGVHRATELGVPLLTQRLHRVGVAVEVDHSLMLGGHAVERVARHPHEVAVVVEPHVVGVADRLHVDDGVAQEGEPRALVVREPRPRVAAGVARFEGEDLLRLPEPARERLRGGAMAMVFHETSVVKVGFAVVLCVMVFYTHRENIGRLLRGEENRMDLAGHGRGTR